MFQIGWNYVYGLLHTKHVKYIVHEEKRVMKTQILCITAISLVFAIVLPLTLIIDDINEDTVYAATETDSPVTIAVNVFKDRVFTANEDSNTVTVIDPETNTVEATIDLTGFDPRMPFDPSKPLSSMHHRPLYNGAIDVHGMDASPDGKLIAVTARGSGNVYLIDAVNLEKVGNPQGIMVGREPHVPMFTHDGKKLWVTVRGSNYIAVIDVNFALKHDRDRFQWRVPTLDGPSMVEFSHDGKLAFVGSQKESKLQVLNVAKRSSIAIIDFAEQDPLRFSPFVKLSPDGNEVWVTHKLSDGVGVISAKEPFDYIKRIQLPTGSKPNHIEFVGNYVYVSLAQVNATAQTSSIAIIDREAKTLVGTFESQGKEAHGIWANPEGTRLYIGHEQSSDVTVFDTTDPASPKFVAKIHLGSLKMQNGELPNTKPIDVVYSRIT